MSDFARNLKRLRKSTGYTLEELADALNARFGSLYSKGTISKWENGTDPNMDSVRNLSTFFGVSLDELLGIKVDPSDISLADQLLPILGYIAAGEPLFAEQHILGYSPCPSFIRSKNKKMFYLRVRGSSMDKEFPDGSNVLVEQGAEVVSGDIAVVMVNGDDATVKRIKFMGDSVVLIPSSNNPEYYAQVYDVARDQVRIVGKVIGAFKSY